MLARLSRSPKKEDETFAHGNVEKNRYAARFPCKCLHTIPVDVLHVFVNFATLWWSPTAYRDTQSQLRQLCIVTWSECSYFCFFTCCRSKQLPVCPWATSCALCECLVNRCKPHNGSVCIHLSMDILWCIVMRTHTIKVESAVLSWLPNRAMHGQRGF